MGVCFEDSSGVFGSIGVEIDHFNHGAFMGEQEVIKQKQVSGVPVCVLFVAILAVIVTAALTGCSDPTFVGRFRAVPVTNIILDSLGVVDEKPEQFAYARDPYPKDLIVEESEYVVQRGDMIEISILDLFMSGAEWRNRLQVSETGRVTVPEIGTFRVAGRTEFEVADDIENLLSPHILKNPTVNVVVIASTEKVFSISGAIAASGRYQLIQSDFRILEAIAQAGGVPQTGIDYVYVVRKISDENLEEIESQLDTEMRTERPRDMMPEESYEMRTEPLPHQPISVDEYSPWQTEQRQQELIQAIPPVPISEKDGQPEPTIEPKEPEPEVIAPPEPKEPEPKITEPPISSEPTQPEPKVVEPPVLSEPEPKEPEEPKPTSEQEWDKLLESIRPMTEIAMPEEKAEPKKKLKIIREDGKFQLIPVDQKPAGQERTEEPLTPERPWRTPSRQGWEGLNGQHQEVIQVDLKALQSGDMTQNIVIRSGDYIQVPYNDVGVFYVMGQVSRPGPYSLQGQRMTLKQVISVAGPLSPLANMNCCDITRRIGRDKEVTCRLNLQKLIEGSQPDIFIKPDDIINIGSHPVARWVAVIRQSFRATYGFGFVYDRNLADKDFGH